MYKSKAVSFTLGFEHFGMRMGELRNEKSLTTYDLEIKEIT